MANGASMGGGQQIIRGQTYEKYSPEWYAAMDSDKVTSAGVSGTAAGTAKGNQINAESPALLGLFGAIGDKMNSSMSSSSSSGGGAPGAGGPSSVRGPVDGVAPVDTSEATRGEFAHAKDQVGQETGGALTGLRSALAGRGLLGSGAESRGTTSVITKGQGELGDTSRAQASSAATLDQKNAEANFTGNIAQRGQDITQRGQDIQREQNVMQQQQANAQMQLQQRQMVLSGLMAALGGAVQSY